MLAPTLQSPPRRPTGALAGPRRAAARAKGLEWAVKPKNRVRGVSLFGEDENPWEPASHVHPGGKTASASRMFGNALGSAMVDGIQSGMNKDEKDEKDVKKTEKPPGLGGLAEEGWNNGMAFGFGKKPGPDSSGLYSSAFSLTPAKGINLFGGMDFSSMSDPQGTTTSTSETTASSTPEGTQTPT